MSLTSRRTAMARKRYKPEEIVAKLRQVDVLVSQGQNMVDAIRQIGVSEVTYYRWRQEFGGLKTEQVKRLAACRRLAEAGCSGNEIMSISRHATLKELVRYTKDADQGRLARNAMTKAVIR